MQHLMTIDSALQELLDAGGSDIVISAGSRQRMRKDGRLTPLDHIITIEDPIEYVHRHQMSIVDQREVGVDTPTFAEGLRAAFREDPDVLLIGEMRDLETISAALTVAETGHLVLATLHTNDAPQAVDRIVDSFSGRSEEHTS